MQNIKPTISGRFHGKRIIVLLGGETAEREVSLATGDAVARALLQEGYDVLRFDWSAARVAEFVRAARGAGAVFIALHGGVGEGGAVQGLLDIVGVPYTGSGILASALALDKGRTKSLAQSAGMETAHWEVWTRARADASAAGQDNSPMPAPYVVKPTADGSSHGITIVETDDGAMFRQALQTALAGEGEVMIERFVAGAELTVGIVDGIALGVCEIRPGDGFYDYASKYERGDTQYLIPTSLGADIEDQCTTMALEMYALSGCRGVARVDFIVEDGKPNLLELNTVPGMTDTSLVPKLAEARGVGFEQLCEWLLDIASSD